MKPDATFRATTPGKGVMEATVCPFNRQPAPLVWVRSPSRLIGEALVAIVNKAGASGHNCSTQPQHAEIAIWDLRGLRAPYPQPGAVPTLAIVSGETTTKEAALHSGYRGYLDGEETGEDLARALATVLGGDLWAEHAVLSGFKNPATPRLTFRQQQVLVVLTEGLSNREIAHRLKLTERTVKAYVSELLYLLGTKTRTELLVYLQQESAFFESGVQ